MNTGLPKPHSIIDQTISGNIKHDASNKRYIFPALNISNNFATLDYDCHSPLPDWIADAGELVLGADMGAPQDSRKGISAINSNSN